MKNKTTEKLPICYAIPGLGVTGEVFGRLSQYLELQIIDWVLPESGESLRHYAARMERFLPDGPVVLIGYSFGGIIAQEIHKRRPEITLVLINTLVDEREKPLWLRIMRYLPLYRLARGKWRIKLLPIYGRRYGLKNREDISILQKMFSESPNALRMWSIQALIGWVGQKPESEQFLRLHGTKDKVFPLTRMRGEGKWIQNGRHFMVWQRAEEVASQIIIRLNSERSGNSTF